MNNETRNLGDLTGPLLVFGGAYSNFQALEALQAVAWEYNIPPERVICTGDTVGYCAQPEETVQGVKDWGIHAIAGNVELNLRNQADDCGCNFAEGGRCDLFSRQWYPFAQEQLSSDSLTWIGQLPLQLRFQYAGQTVQVLHGSRFDVSEFVFGSTPWQVKAKSLDDAQANVILAGHCGIPFADLQQDFAWLNAGVIGMPANDGSPRVWYLLLDDRNGEFSYHFHALTYDHQEANRRMLEKPLPKSYAHTLLTGIWDNCEILPEQETSQQGSRLLLDGQGGQLGHSRLTTPAS